TSLTSLPQIAGLLTRDGGNELRDGFRVVPREQERGHPILARPANPDRAFHARRGDSPDLVQVGARDATRGHRIEVVTRRTVLLEERAALVEPGRQVLRRLLRELGRVALATRARGEHDGRDRHAEAD